MAHDGQIDPTAGEQVLLPDLLTLTGAAVAPAEKILDRARDKLRALVSEGGRVSSRLVEEHQTASHGFAWLATYVQVLRQMQAWAQKLEAEGKFGEMEQLMHQIAFGEYLGQIQGGIPMSQGEILRLEDLGLGAQDMDGL